MRDPSEHAVAEALELQLADDSFLQKADEISTGRNAVARPDFFGDGATAGHLAAFEDDDFLSGACEISRRDEAVVRRRQQ